MFFEANQDRKFRIQCDWQFLVTICRKESVIIETCENQVRKRNIQGTYLLNIAEQCAIKIDDKVIWTATNTIPLLNNL